MTTDVITAPDDASIPEIVAVLTDRKITAVPIVGWRIGVFPTWSADVASRDRFTDHHVEPSTRSLASQ
jgi:CBS-domain-containing membrane protein